MIYIPSKPLGSGQLTEDELKKDKRSASHFEDCGLGEKAIYLSAFGISRITYIPLKDVTRVFKRLAVSKGFFEEGKIYGTLSYLVVRYEGKEKQIRFTHEESVDEMLKEIAERTDIPVGKI